MSHGSSLLAEHPASYGQADPAYRSAASMNQGRTREESPAAAFHAARPRYGFPAEQHNDQQPANFASNPPPPQSRTQKQPLFHNQQQQPPAVATRGQLPNEPRRGEVSEEVASNRSSNEGARLNGTKNIARAHDRPTRHVDRDENAYLPNDTHRGTSFQQPASSRTQPSTNPSHQPSPTGSYKHSKTSPFEPSSPKRVAGTSSSNTSRKPDHSQFPLDTLPIESSRSDLSDHDSIHKNANERFHEALQKLRADRAKKQKPPSETTAKRLQYGNYVRNSNSEDLLQSVVKPPSTANFLELQKGKLLALSQEEKREHVDQSRSYGERIRSRHYDNWHDNEVAKSLQQNALQREALQKSESSKLTPRQRMTKGKSKSFNGTLKQHGADLPAKKATAVETKHRDVRDVNQRKTTQLSRTNLAPQRSVSHRSLNTENLSDYQGLNRPAPQRTKKTVRYAKYDSVGRQISGMDDDDDDDDDDNHDARHAPAPRPIRRMKLRQVGNNLYTLEEEQYFDGSRYTPR